MNPYIDYHVFSNLSISRILSKIVILCVMVITYYGKQFFKVQFGDTVVAYNPIGKESKLEGSAIRRGYCRRFS